MVLKAGDLTAEQAKYEEEKATVQPREADNQRVLFKKPTKKDTETDDKTEKRERKSRKKIKNKSLLSFNDEEEDS